MRYRVLGPVAALDDTEPAVLGGPRARAVLAMLLADAGRVVTDQRLIEGIWGGDAPKDAQHAVQNHVSRLRRAITDDIARDGGGYRLDITPSAVDAHRFDTLVASARERLSDAPAAAGALLRDALALWHGEPYADIGDVPGLQQEIRRLHAVRLSAVEDRVQADLDAGRGVEVVEELEALIREHPFRERLHGMHMLALYRAGRQAEALDVYQRARQVLADELGIDPSPELVELHGRILTQDPDLQPDEPAGPRTTTARPPGSGDLPIVRGFELREHVGDGDFGRTYRAYHASLGREVALKILHAELSDLPDVVRGFDRRAQRIAQLDHPHVVPLLDSWRDPGAVHVVTPWVPAGSVRETLRYGPWSPPAALRMLEQVGAALDVAHRRGIVHGDVKTTNILLSADGSARLTDFSVAPRPRDANGGPVTSDLGAIAPEQRRGAAATIAGDVFGLTAAAIAVLTGHRVHPDHPLALLEDQDGLSPEAIEVLASGVTADASQRPARVVEWLRQLRRAVGADVVAPAGPPDDDGAVRNPYKGLHAFGEDDAVDFFGRGEAIDRLTRAIAAHPLVAVVGPSGSGKSSLVRAGVVPALRSGRLPGSEQWVVAVLYPGSHPFDELAVALRRVAVDPPDDLMATLTADARGVARVVKQILPGDDAQLLLLIDQFEELFSLTRDPAVRRAFLDSLTALADDARGRVRTVVTARADFFGRLLEHHGFGERVRTGLVSVTVPSRDAFAEAVTAPARNVGVEYEPGLVGRIVGDVVDQPGGLPLLQYALTELFARRDGQTLTARAYDETGGVRGALGRRAEALFAALPTAQQELARQLFLRLVTVDEQTGETRRRAHRSELAQVSDDRGAVDAVLQRFGAHRLLTYDHDPVTRGATVEVAHEALLTEWGRLRRWIAERREDLVLRRRLSADVAEWFAADRSDAFLASAGRLEQFVAFAASTDLVVHPDERAFIAASARHAADVARSRRRQRRTAVLALLGAAVLALVLLGVGLVQRGRAAVQDGLRRAASLATASRTAQTTDADLAVLLAAEAVRVSRAAGDRPTSDALGALHEAVLNHRLISSFDVGTFAVRLVDEQRLISISDNGAPAVWDVTTGARERTFEPVTGVADTPIDTTVSADGRRYAEAFFGETPTTVWDVTTGRVIQRLPPVRDGRDIPTFDPTGESLAVVDFGEDGPNVVRVYDVATGAERQRITLAGIASRIAFSPDGGTLAASSSDRPVVELFDLEAGTRIDVVRGPAAAEAAGSVAFDPGGDLLAVVYRPGGLRVHGISDGSIVATGRVDGENPFDICYTADGSVIAVTSLGGVDVFDGPTAQPVTRIRDADIASRASCDANGARVAVGTSSERAQVWDIAPAAAAEVWSAAAPEPIGAAWVEDAVITTHADRRLRRYVPGSGLTATSGIATPRDPFPLATDGSRRLATYSRPEGADSDPYDSVVLRDPETLEVTRQLSTANEPVAFEPDGNGLLVSAFDNVEIVDTESGRPRLTFEGDWFPVTPPGGAFLSDGRHVVVDNVLRTMLFDRQGTEPVATVCTGAFDSAVAASRSGGLFAVAGEQGIEVYDAAQVLAADADASGDCDGVNPVDVAPVALVAGTDVGWMAFNRDGTRVSTVADDGVVSVWDPRTGDLLFAIPHDGDVGGGGFSEDGRRLAVTVDDPAGPADSVRVYAVDVDDLLTIADEKVTRGFTSDECVAYDIAPPCGGTG